MIILDLNQVMIANIMALYGKHLGAKPIELDLFRSTTLNTIRALYKKFGHEYGDLVIACDGKNSWRRSVFPFYKANRRKSRETSDIDWSLVFYNLNTVREELKEIFPYRVICVEGAEADDVIGTIVYHFNDNILNADKILILSGDKDFVQLQSCQNAVVKQFDPINKKYVKSDNPEKFMKEHIFRGDVGDGIPNFLSPDNSLADGIRQKSIMKKKLDVWLSQPVQEFCDDEMLRNYYRNKTLIDLSQTPTRIQSEILSEFDSQAGKDRSKLFNYFIKNKLKVLMESINDF